MKCTAIIAEDEIPARRRLENLVGTVEWLDLVGVASDGLEATCMIDDKEPDLAFLDIRMPGASGLEVLERAEHRPYVVFTTAYDRYAITAFELNAVDYLLKPFSEDRFNASMDRVRELLLRKRSDRTSDERARLSLAQTDTRLERLFVRMRGKIVPLAVGDIVRLEAQGDYVAIHAGGRQHLVHVRLRDLSERLDPAVFVRIHRSHVVNLGCIRSLESYDGHRLLVELQDGSSIVASKSGTRVLRNLVLS